MAANTWWYGVVVKRVCEVAIHGGVVVVVKRVCAAAIHGGVVVVVKRVCAAAMVVWLLWWRECVQL